MFVVVMIMVARKHRKGTRAFDVAELILIRDESFANAIDLADEAELLLSADRYTRAAFLALSSLEEYHKAHEVHSWIVRSDFKSEGPPASKITVSMKKINNLTNHVIKVDKGLRDYRNAEFFGAKMLLDQDDDFRAMWNFYISRVRAVISWSSAAQEKLEESRKLMREQPPDLQRVIHLLATMVTDEKNRPFEIIRADLLYVNFNSEKLKIPRNKITSDEAFGLVGMSKILSRIGSFVFPQGARGYHIKNGVLRKTGFTLLEEEDD